MDYSRRIEPLEFDTANQSPITSKGAVFMSAEAFNQYLDPSEPFFLKHSEPSKTQKKARVSV